MAFVCWGFQTLGQELCKAFWNFEYSEQTAAEDFTKLLETVEEFPTASSCETWLLAMKDGLGKIHGWQRTLRPGQTNKLQEQVGRLLFDLAQKKLASPDSTVTQDDLGFLSCGSLADLCLKAAGVLSLPKDREHDFAKLAEKLRAQATTEARLKLQDSFNEVGKELFRSQLPPTKELMEKFNSAYRTVAGLKLPEDLVPNQVGSEDKKDPVTRLQT